jgi:beta-lactamase regulating signal transducer with metallopeptidase domain
MAPLLETAASNAVVAAVLALVVFPVARTLRRPALAHGLWIVVLAKLVTPSILSIPLPVCWPASIPLEVARLMPEDAPRDLLQAARATSPLPSADPGWQMSSQDAPPALAGGESGNRMGPALPASPALNAAGQAIAQTGPSEQPTAAQFHAMPATSHRDPQGVGWTFSDVVTALLAVWLAGTLGVFALAAVRVLRFRRVMRWAVLAPAALQEESAQIARQIGLRHCPAAKSRIF